MTRAKIVCAGCGKLLGWCQTDDGNPAYELCPSCLRIEMKDERRPNGACIWVLVFLSAAALGTLSGYLFDWRVGILVAMALVTGVVIWVCAGER